MTNTELEKVAQGAAIAPKMPDRVYPEPQAAREKSLSLARDFALDTLREDVPAHFIGEHAGYLLEQERVLTHLFECDHPGYRGWYWGVTLSRAPRSRTATVSEMGLLPGEDAILAPRWVPWADRLEAIENEQRVFDARREASAKGGSTGGSTDPKRDTAPDHDGAGARPSQGGKSEKRRGACTSDSSGRASAQYALGASAGLRRRTKLSVQRGSRGRRYLATRIV